MQLFRKKKVNENTAAAAAEEGTKTAFAAENGSLHVLHLFADLFDLVF